MEKVYQWIVWMYVRFFFFLQEFVFCLINRNSPTHGKKLFLPSAGEDSEELTCVLFFHELGIGNCFKLNFRPLITQLGSW